MSFIVSYKLYKMISSSGKEPERGTLNVSNKITKAIKEINTTKKNDNIYIDSN